MTIKEITCYQTEDGKIWTTVEQAEFWAKCIVSAAAGREAYKKTQPTTSATKVRAQELIDMLGGVANGITLPIRISRSIPPRLPRRQSLSRGF